MRFGSYLFAVLILAGLAGVVFYWHQNSFAQVGNLNIYSGSVEILRGQEKIKSGTGSLIYLADIVRIESNSRASLILKDGSVIRLEAGTEVKISEINYEGRQLKKAIFKLNFGRVWSQVKPLANNGSFEVETPTLVATVRGTSFLLSYLNNTSLLYVDSHKVFAHLVGGSEEKEILEKYLLTVADSSSEKDFISGPLPAENQNDDWILFNQQEDLKFVGQKEIKKLVKLNLIASYNKDRTVKLIVSGEYNDGSRADETGNISSWEQNPQLGEIDQKGYFYPANSGQTSIRASIGNIISNAVLIKIEPAPEATGNVILNPSNDLRTGSVKNSRSN